MPELPEVQTVVDYIKPKLIGSKVKSIETHKTYKRAILPLTTKKLSNLVSNKKILNVTRRAKHIIIHFEDCILSIHLRMTGRIVFKISKNELKYVTVKINLSNGKTVFFKDVRKFGKVKYYKSYSELDKSLGPEPLSKTFKPKHLEAILKKSKRMIKPLLLDQKAIAGLGNIYVDESLFKAGIHPKKSANKINREKILMLYRAIRSILKASIKANGTTFQSFYFAEEGKGEFKSKLLVFGRNGKKCRKCTNIIEKIKIAQRGTHICSNCQKE